ncbi:MAG: adenosine deaminase [Oligoflexia bacterium]|nr:adenosine deaminase [Oligoflexia bacterium]
MPATIIKLAQKNNVKMPFKNEAEFKALCNYSSFEQFVTLFKQIISCLKTPEDYETIAYEYGRECSKQNILYSEVVFSLSTNCKLSGIDWQTLLQRINKGRARAQREFGVTWNWIFDLTRTNLFGPEKFVDILIQSRDTGQGLVAMGLSETLVTYKVAEYQHVFDKAISAKLPIIPHAGEFQGPVSVINSLKACQASRIHHGVRSIEDQTLVQELAKRQIPLDICVSSNVKLGVVANYKQHPIRRLWDAGLLITIGADDPSLFDSNVNQEYDHLIDDYKFTIDELERVSLNGLQAGLLPTQEKELLIQKFKSEFIRLRKNIF